MRNTILLISVLFIFGAFKSSKDYSDAGIMQVAKDNLSKSLSLIPMGQEKGFGFSSRNEFANAEIGKPYRVITLSKDLFNEPDMVADKDYLVIQDEWRVPVTVNGENRVLLTVISKGNELKVVDMGGAELSKELQVNSASLNAKNNFYLMRVYSIDADFITDDSAGSLSDARYIPLNSALLSLDLRNMDHKTLFTFNHLLEVSKKAFINHPKN